MKYKSLLSRKDNSVIFKSENIEKEWKEFVHIHSADVVCDIFKDTFKVQSYEEYLDENKGKNTLTLDSFRSQENYTNYLDEYSRKYRVLRFKGFIEKYGISAATFKKIFNAIMLEIWYIKPYFSRYCYNKYRICEVSVRNLHEFLPLILDAKKNNLDNVSPFIFHTGQNTERLKSLFGKKRWNIICNNSHNRNYLISSRINIYLPKKSFSISLESVKKLWSEFDFVSQLPSTVISSRIFTPKTKATLALLKCIKIKDFIREMENVTKGDSAIYPIIKDTIDYYEKNKIKYSLDCSVEDWYDRHNVTQH